MRTARLVLLTVVVTGCVAVAPPAAPTDLPAAPTPIVVFVTPEPVLSPPLPTATAGPPTASPTASPTPTRTATPTHRAGLSEQCDAEIRPFFDALSDLASRLDVGLNFEQFSDYLGDVAVSYNNIDIDAIDTELCRETAVSLEAAYNEYLDAQTLWNDCLFKKPNCTVEKITAKLQEHFAAATDKIDAAARAFE